MAPLLAIGAYVMTDFYLAPKELAIQQQLRLMGTCQPQENACLFIAGKLELKLISNVKQQQNQLAIISNKPIESMSVALGNQQQFKPFQLMKSDNNKYWQIKLEKSDKILIYNSLRIAITHNSNSYYAESEVHFSGN